ncbi:DUF4160 domain-containing protein [Slackia heliotrinireducens]|uniref:DUF4160 domain-containing protein n=1 Tax=Slackia heliotrinireducens (strain ATCC 29202 / DSM 20476 / NCTC 11029 / RHS 1) TaxID=471855 RepID=C7N254_SLAHD|nr:DUF4160 domain-containing protein [Slackia heliotrinireducens]ACV21360.1 hypothetical protein Shel_02920 [Slackia heliotrinireducens DSM 20476]
MHEEILFDNLEFKEWVSIFDYVYQRGRVGYKNGITFVIHTKERGHNLPHLHARYQGKEVVLEIPSGKVIEGNISRRKLSEASEWVVANADYLEAKWDKLVEGIVLYA